MPHVGWVLGGGEALFGRRRSLGLGCPLTQLVPGAKLSAQVPRGQRFRPRSRGARKSENVIGLRGACRQGPLSPLGENGEMPGPCGILPEARGGRADDACEKAPHLYLSRAREARGQRARVRSRGGRNLRKGTSLPRFRRGSALGALRGKSEARVGACARTTRTRPPWTADDHPLD
jgi:hypothetical protein